MRMRDVVQLRDFWRAPFAGLLGAQGINDDLPFHFVTPPWAMAILRWLRLLLQTPDICAAGDAAIISSASTAADDGLLATLLHIADFRRH